MESISENELLGMKMVESYRYWSKKRILFNVIVGIAGLGSVFIFIDLVTPSDVFEILVWGIVANAMYSTGYILDAYLIFNSKGQKSLEGIRNLLFWGGTVAYVIVSILFALMNSLPNPN